MKEFILAHILEDGEEPTHNELYFNTRDFGWFKHEEGILKIENLETHEGFMLKNIRGIADYLAIWRFADDYVGYDYLLSAIVNCANELGCIYRDVYELEHDIREYYI